MQVDDNRAGDAHLTMSASMHTYQGDAVIISEGSESRYRRPRHDESGPLKRWGGRGETDSADALKLVIATGSQQIRLPNGRTAFIVVSSATNRGMVLVVSSPPGAASTRSKPPDRQERDHHDQDAVKGRAPAPGQPHQTTRSQDQFLRTCEEILKLCRGIILEADAALAT